MNEPTQQRLPETRAGGWVHVGDIQHPGPPEALVKDKLPAESPVKTWTYIGIDPGAGGGLASVTVGRDVHHVEGAAGSIPMPKTERDIWDWIESKWASGFAVIEKVGGYMGGEDNRFLGPAMFKFGMNYGFLRGCLIAVGIPFEEVVPRTWQKGLGILGRKKTESKTAFKNRLKARAQQLFPGEKVTLATADALLIAEFCWRMKGPRGTAAVSD